MINAYQQYRERVESERRAEVAKQRAIIDETEIVLLTISQMPISQKMIQILLNRILSSLHIMRSLTPNSNELRQSIREVEDRLKATTTQEQENTNSFHLPDTDKLIIQYIQAVKKLRLLLRAEHTKGKVDGRTFTYEDKLLERLQLKVNVETLIRRGDASVQSQMLGSARQYFEKAVTALKKQTQPDSFTVERLAYLNEHLKAIQDNLKNTNAQDRAKRKEEERDELDELFAPKKKW
jgi:hypothetical protein